MSALRPDLASLTPDDLAAFANRGLAKRAQREAESSEFTVQWTIGDDGTIVAAWSDEATCTLPGGKSLASASCTCAAQELCRHILRTVLAWQVKTPESSETTVSTEPPTPPTPWDPGAITDAAIEAALPKDRRERALALWKQGIVAEVIRSAKPMVRFYSPGHSIRFLVPGDIHYTLCSCADPAPCPHAALAVKACRLLPAEEGFGLVSTGNAPAAAAGELVAGCRDCVSELMEEGFAGASPVWRDRALRLAAACRADDLPWPGQILEELAADFDRYTQHDALFSPLHSVDRAGELLIRLDVITAGNTTIPAAFVRGLKTDRDADIGSARFIGLGASIQEERGRCLVSAYLQELDTGHVLTLERAAADPADDTVPPRPYHVIGRLGTAKDSNLFQLASGQLVMQGGRRTADGKLVIGRARAAVNPQSFRWEDLKAPVLVEDFAEIAARLRMMPPSSLRPRRAAGDFHVCPLSAVEHAHFDTASQSVIALLRDRSGGQAMLIHPWSRRGAGGAEALLSALLSQEAPAFVAGTVSAGGKVWHPSAYVTESSGVRRAVLPWISPPDANASAVATGDIPARALHSWPDELRHTLADLIVTGRRRAGSGNQLEKLAADGEARGYIRLPALARAAGEPTGMLSLLKAARLALDSGA